jgi:hypothetical protein
VAAFDEEATIEDDKNVEGDISSTLDVAPVRKVSRISSSVYNFNRKNELPDSRNLASQLRTTNIKNGKGDENALSGAENSLEKMGN